MSGPPAPELFDPVVAFARAHLVDQMDSLDRDASTPVHVRRTSPHLPMAEHERGIFIDVDPRTVLGQLTVGNRWVDGATSARYCLRVVHQGDRVVVLVELLATTISAR